MVNNFRLEELISCTGRIELIIGKKQFLAFNYIGAQRRAAVIYERNNYVQYIDWL